MVLHTHLVQRPPLKDAPLRPPEAQLRREEVARLLQPKLQQPPQRLKEPHDPLVPREAQRDPPLTVHEWFAVAVAWTPLPAVRPPPLKGITARATPLWVLLWPPPLLRQQPRFLWPRVGQLKTTLAPKKKVSPL